MSFRSRVKKVIVWGLLLVVTSLAGAFWFAYTYATDSATLTRALQAEASRFAPGSHLEVGRVRVRPFVGEVNLTHLSLRQTVDGAPFQALRVPWLHVRLDPRKLLRKRFEPIEVIVAQPTLRLRRRRDGTWNLEGLLADPWPYPPTPTAPPVLIQNGTVELVDDAGAAAILRDVSVRIVSGGGQVVRFEGSAKGDVFDRLSLDGTIDRGTGRITLKGDVDRLVLSETLRRRLPVEVQPAVERLGLSSGELDVSLGSVAYDPGAVPALRYEGAARLRSGVWNCPKLPFPLSGVSARVSVRDGVLAIERAEGYNGSTTVRVERGRIGLADPARLPMAMHVDVIDLELDRRLKAWTPPEFAGLWDEFTPRGRISLALDLARPKTDAPVACRTHVDCHDVALIYRYFKYPVEHVRGSFDWEGRRVTLNLETLIGGKPLAASGTIDDPGPAAHVMLDFQGQALPIDKALLDALPPDVRKVVDDFQPTGTVRGLVHVERTPPTRPADPPEGIVRIDAILDLNERCAIRWAGMPYPVTNLTGRLELHPDLWVFKNMRGGNGQAEITASGRVEKVPGPGDPLKVDLHLKARHLPFDDQLRSSLQPAWQKTWATLNPIGASDVDATIKLRPGQPDDYHLVIDPQPESSVRLEFSRDPKPGIDPGGTFDLRMENVKGRFVFDNGTVAMRDVGFLFRGSPVQFESGTVLVKDSGAFALAVAKVWARDFRLDGGLRKIMPPVMAEFARRLDDGKPIPTIKGDLALSWSGQLGAPVVCRWANTLVVLNDNAIQAGMPLEHLQGQLDHVSGWSNGDDLGVKGALRLDSVSLLGQQLTELESPIEIGRGVARLGDIRGKLLGGVVTGGVEVTLDATPRYAARVDVQGADLQQYARTQGGRQTYRGLVAARLDINGLGADLHTLQGQGEAHVTRGDLGELPVLLRLLKKLNLSAATKTAFDSADVAIAIHNGESVLDPIKLTGNAFSLQGGGTVDTMGDLNLRLNPLYGRDRVHVPILSDALREASGQLFVIRVQGPIAYPRFKLEPLPRAAAAFRSIGSRRADRRDSEQD